MWGENKMIAGPLFKRKKPDRGAIWSGFLVQVRINMN